MIIDNIYALTLTMHITNTPKIVYKNIGIGTFGFAVIIHSTSTPFLFAYA